MKAQIISEASGYPMGLIVEVVREIDQHKFYVKSREVAKAIPESDVKIIKETN